ncbi:hypothetical protein FK535_06870 [Mycolicibacterium sp. 018/SC-01/001]|uniref:hypothetical protein n=1 Tax=Mycolicibacterium sp. 018/SC-01/001 TaxID=2592069 RepID=UPI00117FC694|nr:hypothetical protein [Mycolicibacterium sp. 018/SC-01/001]TRW86191.1 hypothetical protein FK535_06870 [Mycolicibacterium sp. 018/SC-01/001]
MQADEPTGAASGKRSVPTFGRGIRLHAGTTSNPVTGTSDDYSVYAYYSPDDGFFELSTHDDGHWPVDEYHQAHWVEADDIAVLLHVLGGDSDADPAELFARRVHDGSIGLKDAPKWLSRNAIPYSSGSQSVSNL